MHRSGQALLALAALLGGAQASPGAAQVTAERIAAGLTNPLWAGAPAGDARLFIAEKAGLIRVLENGALRSAPFLDLTSRVTVLGEQGLLGLAFHPAYATNGFCYVDYTDLNGDTVVARYTASADPNLIDPLSESIVLRQGQPAFNHNGGDLHFGPDGMLYVFFGDGGSANDPACRAQKLGNWLGKILRLDVDSATPYAVPPDNPFVGVAGARGEIWHYGLRNPWRNSFDRLTGDLFIGDVGQDLREELDVAPAGSAGLNFGWKVLEGTLCNSTASCDPLIAPCGAPSYTAPVLELLHAGGSFAITGGYVYRGCACPGEYGAYFFSDYADHRIRSLTYDRATGTIANLVERTLEFDPPGGPAIRNLASFGEDGFGELLIIDESGNGSGEVYRMVPAGAPAATVTMRNGAGGNRPCLLSASRPILGNVWEARIDASVHPGATLALLVGYAAPTGGVFAGANEILVDTTSARLFRLARASSGASDVFRSNVPCDAALAGVTTYVQAVIGGGGLELCNALDVTAGYF